MKRKTQDLIVKRKTQVKKSIPKWIPPEKRMKTYSDYGYTDHNSDISKVKFPKFRIVVASEDDKQQLQAAFEYLHDNRLIDTDFVAVNCLVHSYCEPPDGISPFVVDDDVFHHMEQRTCPHTKTYIQDGIEYCHECWKALKVLSYGGR